MSSFQRGPPAGSAWVRLPRLRSTRIRATPREIELTIEKPAAGGRMIARHEGRVVLVRGAIPGELARVRLDDIRRDVAYGTAVEILRAVPERRPASGDPRCGGCDYAHIDYPRQLSLKSEIVADAFARIGRIRLDERVPIVASPERGYRMRTRVHVRGRRLGFFRKGTHALCDAAATGQLAAGTAAVVPVLAQALPHLDVASRDIEAIDITENVRGEELALHVELAPGARIQAGELAPLAIEGVRGLSASASRTRRPAGVSGDPSVADRWNDLRPSLGEAAQGVLRRHPSAFFQANRFLLTPLVEWVTAASAEGPIADLYAGVGLFAVTLAAAGVPITAVEGDPVNAADLIVNAAPFGDGVRVVRGSVEEFLRARPPAPATVIVDPPRTGLSREACAGLAAWCPKRVVYVSCDVATLARDVRRLTEAGYGLAGLQAFDMFPTTSHIEVGAVMVRQTDRRSSVVGR